MRAFLIVKRFAIKNILYIFCAIVTALAVLYLGNTIPDYKLFLFHPSRLFLNCLSPSIKTLVTIIDAIVTACVFVYFVAIGIKVAQKLGTTSEPKIVSHPFIVYFTVLLIMIFQSLLSAKFAVYCN